MNRASTPLKKKRGKTGNYFTSETQQAIIEYVNEPSVIRREIIFKNSIIKAVSKICEIYYWKISTPYLDKMNSAKDIQMDCLSHLVTYAFPKFKNYKGKAYSYLSIAARNYYIVNNNLAYTAYKLKNNPQTFDGLEIVDESFDVDNYNKEFIKTYYDFIIWVTDNIDDLPYSKQMKNTMLNILEFMDDFNEIQKYFKLEVNSNMRSRYNITEGLLVSAKNKLQTLWLQYKNNIDNEQFDKKPQIAKYSQGKKEIITDDTKDYIINNYQSGTNKYNAVGLSIKLAIPLHRIYDIIKEEKGDV